MSDKLFPTKGNLILAKKTYKLSEQGYELLDKKRNILLRELMQLIDKAKNVQGKINKTFEEAYLALQKANISMGITNVQNIANAVHDMHDIQISFRSVMGVEIPEVKADTVNTQKFSYGLYNTNSQLDEAYLKFSRAVEMSIELAEIENAVYALATNIRNTQKRANALKNIMIPKYQNMTKFIQNALEEKEREEFIRSKVIKKSKGK